jgi:hypothetical protein
MANHRANHRAIGKSGLAAIAWPAIFIRRFACRVAVVHR